MGQKALGPCRLYLLCRKQAERSLEEERREEGRACHRHAYSLQRGEGPVRGQGLSHRPGTIISDCVALEAVGTRRGPEPPAVSPRPKEAAADHGEEGSDQHVSLTACQVPWLGRMAPPRVALAPGFPLGL